MICLFELGLPSIPVFAAFISLLSLLLATIYNWKSYKLRRSEYSYAAATKAINELSEHIHDEINPTSMWVLKGIKDLKPELDVLLRTFNRLRLLFKGTQDRFLVEGLEVEGPTLSRRLAYLMRNFAIGSVNYTNDKYNWRRLDESDLACLAYIYRIIHAPSLREALNVKYVFSQEEIQKIIKKETSTSPQCPPDPEFLGTLFQKNLARITEG